MSFPDPTSVLSPPPGLLSVPNRSRVPRAVRAVLPLILTLLLVPLTAAQVAPNKTTPDVVYGRRDGLALTLDVIRPAQANGAAVVMIAGAGFISGPVQKGIAVNQCAAEFLKRGYTLFVVGHASQPKFTVPEIRTDIVRAVRYVRCHAKDHGIDPERVGLCGASSGGLLALLAATTGDGGTVLTLDPVEGTPSRVAAVGVFFPPTDYLNYGKEGQVPDTHNHPKGIRAPYDFHEFDAETTTYQRVTNKLKKKEIYQSISPIYNITKQTPPTVLIHGDKDELVPIQQSEVFAAKLKAVGGADKAKLVTMKGKGHFWPKIEDDLAIIADWFDVHLTKK